MERVRAEGKIPAPRRPQVEIVAVRNLCYNTSMVLVGEYRVEEGEKVRPLHYYLCSLPLCKQMLELNHIGDVIIYITVAMKLKT